MLKSATSLQLAPFQSSVTATTPGGASPANASAELLLAPAPANSNLAVFKSATSVQALPFHNSVFAYTVGGVLPP